MKFKMGGSGIHIKPENKGKFTATKKATGKTTEELTHSKNPVTKKRAIFAQNAAKFKHADGSKNVGFPDLNKDGKLSKADILVGRGVIPAKKMQMGNKGTKANKPTKDSSNFFKRDYITKRSNQMDAEREGYSEDYDTNERTFLKGEAARKAKADLERQANKGKSGFDRNGYPLDKKMCGSKGMKYAEGTKSIKFKKPMMKRADGSTSQRGLWDNIRANKGSGKKPTPEMLKQEKKIKAKTGK
jgi:hypothetical protein